MLLKLLFGRISVSLVIFVIFFTIELLTLPHYGVNWDTINHLPRGQTYLHYFLTGKRDFSDLSPVRRYYQDPESIWTSTDVQGENNRRSIYQDPNSSLDWYLENDGNGHPPLSDIISSTFNLVLFQQIGLINDIDSHRVYGILLSSLLVALIFYWGSTIYGKFAGLVSVIVLATYPLFFSESHFNNEKDIPEGFEDYI